MIRECKLPLCGDARRATPAGLSSAVAALFVLQVSPWLHEGWNGRGHCGWPCGAGCWGRLLVMLVVVLVMVEVDDESLLPCSGDAW